MNEQNVFETAKVMFLSNSGRKEVIDFLLESGVDKTQVDNIATKAYKEIKGTIKELQKTQEVEEKKAMDKSLLLGICLLVGAIIATFTTNRIWYGAMGVGLVMIVNGISKS